MKNFSQALDKYLTTPPDDGFTDYCEDLYECFTEKFFDDNDDWLVDETDQVDKWLEKLFYKEIDPKTAALIIERAHSRFIKKNQ